MKFTAEEINSMIADLPSEERALVKDGYHTFADLYEHRHAIFIALCNMLPLHSWKSKLHSDGTGYDGWFLAGIFVKPGKQISYHMPMSQWMACRAKELEKAPEFDGHTSDDVIVRLLNL